MTFGLYGQDVDSLKNEKPIKLPIWTIVVPGASYYHQKKYFEGTLFATLEIGLTYIGIKYEDELKSNSVTPYYNFPKSLGIMAFKVEKLTNLKIHLENVKYRNPDFRYHDISEKELYLAPFKRENILTPVTGVMVCLAGATLAANYFVGLKNGSPSIKDVEQMSFAGNYISRNQALSGYLPVGFAYGWGAGVVEEYQFRNWLLPLLDHKYGQRKGLIFSSLAFGAAHAPNFLFDKKPDYGLMAVQVVGTTLGGMFYAWDVQRRSYNIGPSVAAHAWFDTVLMVGSFLINPENNFLGANLKLKL